MTTTQKGFTLIELIVTIAILAILVAILVVAINPAEQLARARDTKRVADLDALKTALNLYLAQATTTINLSGDGTADARCKGGTGTATLFTFNSTAATTTATYTARSASTTQTIGGAGWLPARFDLTPGGSPISNLPIEPKGTGDSTYFYAYVCDTTGSNETYMLVARLESSYFATDLDVDGKDGGGSATTYLAATYYEVGSDPGLDLLKD